MIIFFAKGLRFRLDQQAGQLLQDDKPIQLRPKEWELLSYLAENPGKLISRKEIQDRIWGKDNTNVSEASLSKAVAGVRRALGDQADAPLIISTVQARGYRFIAEIDSDTAACNHPKNSQVIQPDDEVKAAHGSPFALDHRIISVAKLPATNTLLIGREHELALLDHAWPNPDIRLATIVAYGGVGKTSLAINWWHRLQTRDYDGRRAGRVLGWSFYSQGAAEDRQASADPFLDHALRQWFGISSPPEDSWQRGEKLAELIRNDRTLLILDGLEPIQHPPGAQHGRLRDPGMIALLKELSAHSDGLCLCTSRLPLTDLEDYGGAGVLALDLDNLTKESGAEYLKQLGVQGPENELEDASEEFDNHALALTLLGSMLVKRRGGQIQQRDTIPNLFIDPKKGGHARRVYRFYEQLFKDEPQLDVLRMLGLFDRPADPDALHILRKGNDRLLPRDAWAEALENLKDARLVEYADPEGTLDCHPLVREHFADEYRVSKSDSFRGGQERLYEHYAHQAPNQPSTLREMEPLLWSVYHGCQAGQHFLAFTEIYKKRLRAEEFFLIYKLGAYGIDLSILANFFEQPWTKSFSSLSAYDSWILGQAGLALWALGRLDEAIEPTRLSLPKSISEEDWKDASQGTANLSELYLALGHIPNAIDQARRCVEFADSSADEFERMGRRTTLATALHQFGDYIQAGSLFEEAEKIQAQRQPWYPILYSAFGYRYCDLLIEWDRKGEVVLRATQTLKWAEKRGLLLDIALDHLSLGRAFPSDSGEAGCHLDLAIEGIRKAGTIDVLPGGYLARAANRRIRGDFGKAQDDLDEARILSTRCGLRLHLTDYHLEQARLFFAQQQPDRARLHYDAAKNLVRETDYHRRDSELSDLAAQLWTVP